MKSSKKLAIVFFGIALIALCAMCIITTSAVVNYAWIINKVGNPNNVPFYFAFLEGIPSLLIMIVALIFASIFWKKSKQVAVQA